MSRNQTASLAVLGVDVGWFGGYGLYSEEEGFLPWARRFPLRIDRIPRPRKRKNGRLVKRPPKVKRSLDEREFVKDLKEISKQCRKHGFKLLMALEEQFPRPDDSKQGVAALMTFFGFLRGAAAALNIPVAMVRPMEWRPNLVGIGADKKVSLNMARQAWPHEMWEQEQDEGKAEGLLIAFYLYQKLAGRNPREEFNERFSPLV